MLLVLIATFLSTTRATSPVLLKYIMTARLDSPRHLRGSPLVLRSHQWARPSALVSRLRCEGHRRCQGPSDSLEEQLRPPILLQDKLAQAVPVEVLLRATSVHLVDCLSALFKRTRSSDSSEEVAKAGEDEFHHCQSMGKPDFIIFYIFLKVFMKEMSSLDYPFEKFSTRKGIV